MADESARARAWHRGMLETLCDSIEPWDQGEVLIATQYPDYWNYNVVQVQGDPGLSADELIAVADEKLARFKHRRVDFLDADAAEAVRADFESAGWQTTRLVYMVHSKSLPPGETLDVEEVDYDAVVDLRREWNAEDFPGIDQESHLGTAKEVSSTRDARVIASLEDGEAVGFAQLEYIDGSAEITHAFVSAKHRGSGRGTAITRAAIEAAIDDVDDLFIVADDEDRPKELYKRLGFRPAWTTTEFLRLPPG
jgi:ribosomal protein S18 acetylase RimI-like enzyme